MLLDTPICDFGWKAPDFTLADPDGKQFTMSEHLGDKGLLVMFICNHCPYVVAVVERLAQDTSELMDNGIDVLAVMSNDYSYMTADSPPEMKKFATRYGLRFPYLVDQDQRVGKAYGAICTPDFFGLNAKGELQYRGRLDDVSMKIAETRNRELFDAMMQIAETGEGPREQLPSMGCSIKWR